MPPEIMETPPFPGTKETVHGRAPFHAPRSPIWTAAPVCSPGTPRAAVWGGRGGRGGSGGTRERAGASRGMLKTSNRLVLYCVPGT